MNFHKIMEEYLHDFNPFFVVLFEIRVSKVHANSIIKIIGMPKSLRVKAKC